jgi:hypothetical protein
VLRGYKERAGPSGDAERDAKTKAFVMDGLIGLQSGQSSPDDMDEHRHGRYGNCSVGGILETLVKISERYAFPKRGPSKPHSNPAPQNAAERDADDHPGWADLENKVDQNISTRRTIADFGNRRAWLAEIFGKMHHGRCGLPLSCRVQPEASLSTNVH